MKGMREAIAARKFADFRAAFYASYAKNKASGETSL
jgi:queuine/archaeosine tRNA-ribosyltransferase